MPTKYGNVTIGALEHFAEQLTDAQADLGYVIEQMKLAEFDELKTHYTNATADMFTGVLEFAVTARSKFRSQLSAKILNTKSKADKAQEKSIRDAKRRKKKANDQ